MTWRSQILSNRVCPGIWLSSPRPTIAWPASRTATPSSFGVAHNGARAEGKTAARFYARLLRRRLLRVLAPALLLGVEEGGEDLADGALGDVAGDEHHAALAVVALGPGVERGWRMKDVLHAVDDDGLGGVLDVQDALHAQEIGAAIGDERVEGGGHGRPAHRLVEGHAEGFDAVVVAVDVVWVLLAVAVLVIMPVPMLVIVAMMMVIVPAAVRVFVRFLVQPALDVGVLGLGIVEAGIQDLVRIDLARRDLMERRAGIELVQATLELVERACVGDVALGEQQAVGDGGLLHRLL